MIRESLEEVATSDLRRGMSEIINRAAYGSEPVVLTKRGHPVAAIISHNDLVFLMSMKKKRDALRRRPMPSDTAEVGLELARRLREELFFD
jgi:prevent-host-death family protein